MSAQFGKPPKSVVFIIVNRKVRGEAVISEKGLEGCGVYEVTRDLRQNHDLKIDLLPNWSVKKIAHALNKPKGKASQSNFWRKALKLDSEKQALLNEFGRTLTQTARNLATLMKSLPVRHEGLFPLNKHFQQGAESSLTQ